jgi:hypothetical protein
LDANAERLHQQARAGGWLRSAHGWANWRFARIERKEGLTAEVPPPLTSLATPLNPANPPFRPPVPTQPRARAVRAEALRSPRREMAVSLRSSLVTRAQRGPCVFPTGRSALVTESWGEFSGSRRCPYHTTSQPQKKVHVNKILPPPWGLASWRCLAVVPIPPADWDTRSTRSHLGKRLEHEVPDFC